MRRSKTNLQKGHTFTNLRPGQYPTHAHSHITQAVAAMDSSFALIGTHQHGIAVGSMNGENSRVSKTVKGVCMPLAVSLSYEEWLLNLKYL